MGMAHIALAVVVVASIVGGATQVVAIELGEVQAVQSHSPPYIFRLPLLTPLHGPSAIAAVTVRRPPDTLSFVKQRVVEFRLRSLSDVELEVSYGGQTLNRLLLNSELQAARMRMNLAPASNPSLLARGKGRERLFTKAMPMAQAPAGASDRSLIERELEGIRQEIHSLVEGVAPWEGSLSLLGDRAGETFMGVLTLMLAGFCIVGVSSLITGCLMQRRALDRQRRRRQALTVSIRRMRAQLTTGGPILPARQPASPSRAPHEALAPVTIMRRVRMTQKTRRWFRVWTPSDASHLAREHNAEPSRLPARTSQRVPAAPAELLDALAQLRGELMRLQARSTTSPTPNHAEAKSRRPPPSHAEQGPYMARWVDSSRLTSLALALDPASVNGSSSGASPPARKKGKAP